MRIILTGGGTGGHFYPLVAVAEAVQDISVKRNLIDPEMFYVGPEPFDTTALAEHDIAFQPSPAGRLRRYPSIFNVLDILRTAVGIVRSSIQLYNLYPDVVFSTGGFAAFPTVFAARILAIPVVIYDADAKPGRVSLWSAKFAKRIAVAHTEAAASFPEKVRHSIARTGHPIRKEIEVPAKDGGHEFLKITNDVPTVFIMGGSQGARAINEAILDALPALVLRYNVIHQAGRDNVQEVSRVADVILKDNPHKERYRPFGLLNTLAIRMAAGIADIIVARAGSGTIYEVASWGIPAVLVPIPLDISHDQTENAFSYARSGACSVIEQRNLTPHILVAEIDRIVSDATVRKSMQEAAHAFARPQAADKIADMLLAISLEHETA